MKRSTKRLLTSIVEHILIYGIMFITIFPILWMVLASFQPHQSIINQANHGLFEFEPTLENYLKVFTEYNFLEYTKNSLIVAAVAVILSLLIGLPCAYAIARFKMHRSSVVVLLVRMIPGISFLLPWFTIFSALGLRNRYTALVLSHMLVALPFIVWIMIPNFESIPRELEEAAWIDGCSQYGAFLRVSLRLSTPGIVTASLLAFIFSWNNFMFSLVLAGRDTTTLPVAVFQFVSYAYIDWGGLMAASVAITLPIIILALCLQKHIISGLTAGAVKG